jgi:hypothetical protein
MNANDQAAIHGRMECLSGAHSVRENQNRARPWTHPAIG